MEKTHYPTSLGESYMTSWSETGYVHLIWFDVLGCMLFLKVNMKLKSRGIQNLIKLVVRRHNLNQICMSIRL